MLGSNSGTAGPDSGPGSSGGIPLSAGPARTHNSTTDPARRAHRGAATAGTEYISDGHVKCTH